MQEMDTPGPELEQGSIMDHLISESDLGPELVRLLKAKLSRTMEDLAKECKRSDLLQSELEVLQRERDTLIGTAGSEGMETETRPKDNSLSEEQAAKIISLKASISQLEGECARRETEANRYRQALVAAGREPNLDFALALASLPQPSGNIPRRDTLLPCLPKRWKDPTLSFPTEARAACPPGNTLFFCQRIFWYSDEGIHAIALSPPALYRPEDQSWIANDEFTCLLNQTKEVFYRGTGQGNYYAGTFKCAYKGDLSTSDFRNLPAVIKEALVQTSFSGPNTARIRTKSERSKLRKMYLSGERKVVFLALQCVGFNQKLYDAFIAARSSPVQKKEQVLSQTIGKRRRQEEQEFERAFKAICDDDRARSETQAFGGEVMA